MRSLNLLYDESQGGQMIKWNWNADIRMQFAPLVCGATPAPPLDTSQPSAIEHDPVGLAARSWLYTRPRPAQVRDHTMTARTFVDHGKHS